MTIDRLMILYAPVALEEAVVDCMLSLESAFGFNSFPVNFHHHENKKLTLAEQVSGRQKQICFQIYTDVARAELLQNKLKQEFNGVGIQLRILSILEDTKI